MVKNNVRMIEMRAHQQQSFGKLCDLHRSGRLYCDWLVDRWRRCHGNVGLRLQVERDWLWRLFPAQTKDGDRCRQMASAAQ